MNNLYCLVFKGDSVTDELASFLFRSAQNMMYRRDRKLRLSKGDDGFVGCIATDYKLGMMGTVSGFTFSADIEWDDGATKVDFMARPVSQALLNDLMENMRWVRANREFLPEPEPWRN